MDATIKRLFEEIPAFDHPEAVKILNENSDQIENRILEVSSTTLEEDEEKKYKDVRSDLAHTIHKEVKMVSDSYERWQESKSESDRDEYEFIYNQAIKHLRIDLAIFLVDEE